MTKAMILSIFALCFVGFGSCTHVKYGDCGGEDALSKLVFVDVTPCNTQPCILKKGTEEAIQIQFVPKVNITAANTTVHGELPDVPLPVPFPVEQPNACKDHGLECPLIAGKTYTFKTNLPVKSMYPSLQLVVIWELDSQDKKVYCFKIAVKIVG